MLWLPASLPPSPSAVAPRSACSSAAGAAYGAKAKAQYQAEKAAAAKATAERDNDNGQPEPLSDPNDPATYNSTIHSQPAPGAPPSPFGPGPSGSLPDPMNHPEGGPAPQP